MDDSKLRDEIDNALVELTQWINSRLPTHNPHNISQLGVIHNATEVLLNPDVSTFRKATQLGFLSAVCGEFYGMGASDLARIYKHLPFGRDVELAMLGVN